MSTHRVTITTINEKPGAVGECIQSHESKVFEQTFTDLNVNRVIQQLNAQPRRRQKKGGAS